MKLYSAKIDCNKCQEEGLVSSDKDYLIKMIKERCSHTQPKIKEEV